MCKRNTFILIVILLFCNYSNLFSTDLRVGKIIRPSTKEYVNIPIKLEFEVENINVLTADSYTVLLKILSPQNSLIFQETISDANLPAFSKRTLKSSMLFIPEIPGNYELFIEINFSSDIDTSNNKKQTMFEVINIPGIQILPNWGIDFVQLDIDLPEYKKPNSSIGLVSLDFNKLMDSTKMTSGFVNIYNPNLGWVIQNMIYDHNLDIPGLSAMFNLKSDSSVTNLKIFAILSKETVKDTILLSDIIYLNYLQYNVGSSTYNIGGKTGSIKVLGPPIPITVLFDSTKITEINWQHGHVVQEQDKNQCGPGALANSLQWLKEKKGLSITDTYKPGIKDSSLVGKIDITTGRVPHKGLADSSMMKGKLTYIDNNKLNNKLKIKHKVVKGYKNSLSNSDTIKVGKTFSVANKDTTKTLIDWIISEIKHGEDVELGVMWTSGGGHWVDLIGGGYINGNPWIAWVNDANQGFTTNGTTTTSDDSVKNNGGLTPKQGGYGWSYITKNKNLIYIAGADSSNGVLDLAFSESIDSTVTGIDDEEKSFVPNKYNLEQNYPNPFNPSTTISYQIPVPGKVTLKIYDILGREVTTLVNKEQKAGNYKVNFDASGLASGVYFYRITAGQFVSVKKMILMK